MKRKFFLLSCLAGCGDCTGNTGEENYSVFSLIRMR